MCRSFLVHCSLLNENRPQSHVLLAYDNKKKLNDAIVDFLNTGLENGQLCVYAYVNLEQSFFAKLNDGINDFDRHISNNELLLVGLKPYKIAIINGHYDMFENFKDYLINKASRRNDKFIRLVGDLATNFFYEEKYEHWKSLEEWMRKDVYPNMHYTLDLFFTLLCMNYHLLISNWGKKAYRWYFGYPKDPFNSWKKEKNLKQKIKVIIDTYFKNNEKYSVNKDFKRTIFQYKQNWSNNYKQF